MRIAIAMISALTVLLVLAGAGFVYSGAYYVGADQPHWSVVAWALDQARIRSIRAHASGITVPSDFDHPDRIVVGVSHYADHCAVCHGAPGVERGEIADGLYPRPPNLADAARLYTPSELFWILKHGIRMTGMPAWGDHSDDELWATVALIEKLPGMTDQGYANLIEASRAVVGHHHDTQEPQSTPRQPAEKDHDHSAGHHDHLPGHDH